MNLDNCEDFWQTTSRHIYTYGKFRNERQIYATLSNDDTNYRLTVNENNTWLQIIL